MTHHTHGPWATDIENCGGGMNLRDKMGRTIGHTSAVRNMKGVPLSPEDCIERDEAKANARLIAAAPELLAALKALLFDCLHGNGAETWASHKDQARAAIDKAEGCP